MGGRTLGNGIVKKQSDLYHIISNRKEKLEYRIIRNPNTKKFHDIHLDHHFLNSINTSIHIFICPFKLLWHPEN